MHVRLAAVLSFLSFAAWSGAVDRQATSPTADILIINGHVYTSDPAQPWAEAVAIRADKILGVGKNKELASYRGTGTQVIDAGGRMVMPGMIDTHTHFLGGSYGLAGVQLYEARNVEQVTKVLRDYAKSHPEEKWVYGAGWYYGSFWPSGLPKKALLDEVFPDRPVSILSEDGHSLWVNSEALRAAKITRDTPDPTGAVHGIIVRENGEPTGVLEEGAKRLVLDVMDTTLSQQDKFRRLRIGMRFANQHVLPAL